MPRAVEITRNPNTCPGRKTGLCPLTSPWSSSRVSQISTRTGSHSTNAPRPASAPFVSAPPRASRAAYAPAGTNTSAIRRASRTRHPESSKSSIARSRTAPRIVTGTMSARPSDAPRTTAGQSTTALVSSSELLMTRSCPTEHAAPRHLRLRRGCVTFVDQLRDAGSQAVAREGSDVAPTPEQDDGGEHEVQHADADPFRRAQTVGEHAAVDELREEQPQQGERFPNADRAVGEHRDCEHRLGGGEEELLALERVEWQPVEDAGRDREDHRQRPDEQRPLVDLRRDERAQPGVRVQAPGEEAGDEELGRFGGERGDPLDEEERADPELFACGDERVGERLG